METLLDLVSYLPYSFSQPIKSFLLQAQSTSPTASQVVPLLLSLIALYYTLLSAYNTARFALRSAWFMMKWGTLLVALGGGVAGLSNWNKSGADGSRGLGVGDMIGLGKRGLDWWGADQRSTFGNSRRSASGVPRTWSRSNEDGEWDDPSETTLGAGLGMEDITSKIGEVVMTFLGNSDSSDTSTRKSGGKKQKERKKENGGIDVAGLAMRYGKSQARKAWDRFAGL